MRNFKRNYKRNRYRSNSDRGFQRNNSEQKLNSNFSNNSNFKRTNLGRNNQNASKLAEKYTNLAREALSNGDKILSEHYYQHADHFVRLISDKENEKNIVPNNAVGLNGNESVKNNQVTTEENNQKTTEQDISTQIELNTSEN